jgi:hypothetical protein
VTEVADMRAGLGGVSFHVLPRVFLQGCETGVYVCVCRMSVYVCLGGKKHGVQSNPSLFGERKKSPESGRSPGRGIFN